MNGPTFYRIDPEAEERFRSLLVEGLHDEYPTLGVSLFAARCHLFLVLAINDVYGWVIQK